MPRLSYILVTVIVLVVSVAILGWSFFGLGSPSKTQQTSKQTTQSAAVDPGYPKVPVSIENSAVKVAQVRYIFHGTIKELKNGEKGLQIVTDITAQNLPEFIVTSKTYVGIGDGKSASKKASSSSLQTGQTVNIWISYGLKNKTWDDVESATIIQGEETSAPAPSTKTQ